MAAGLVETDIDQFIRNQKAKLQQERHVVGDRQGGRTSSRKQWDKTQDNRYANQRDRPQTTEEKGFPLTNDKAEQKKAELNRQRQREYNELLQNQKTPRQKRLNKRLDTPETGLQLGSYEQKRKQYDAERQQDLINQLSQKPVQAPRKGPPRDRERKAPPSRDRRRAPPEAVTRIDPQQKDDRPRLRQKEPTPPYDGMKFGDFEEYRKKVEEQRKQEYKHELEQQVEEKRRKKAEARHKENVELASRHPFVPVDSDLLRMQREEQRRKAYDKRLAERRGQGGQDLSPRSRSPTPEPQFESYIEERLRREAEVRQQEEEARREAEARREYDEQLTERELQRQQDLLQRTRLESLEDELRDEHKPQRGDPFRPAGVPPEERSKEYQRLTELLPSDEPRKQLDTKEVFIEGQEKYEDKIKTLQDQRNKEYNELIAKQRDPRPSKPPEKKEEGGALLNNLGEHDRKKKELDEQRHQEYLEYQEQQRKKKEKRRVRSPLPRRKPKTPESEKSDKQVSDYVLQKVYETEMHHLDEEKRELNEFLDKKRKVQQAEHKRRNKDLSPREAVKRQDLSPPGRDSPDMVSKLGGYSKERAKFDDERKKEYNKLLAEQAEALKGLFKGISSVVDNDDDDAVDPSIDAISNNKTTVPVRGKLVDHDDDEEFQATLPGLRSHKSAENKDKQEDKQVDTEWLQKWLEKKKHSADIKPYSAAKLKKRNEEYNEYLRQRQGGRHHPDRKTDRAPVTDKYADAEINRPITEPAAISDHEKKNKDVYATLPGLNYSESAEVRKRDVRNREYNDLLYEKDHREEERKRKIELRNREYNEYKFQKESEDLSRKEAALRQRAYEEYLRERDYWYNWTREGRPGYPRKGWNTPPSYDEILEQKRREEALYRRVSTPHKGRSPSSETISSSIGQKHLPSPLPPLPQKYLESYPRTWRHDQMSEPPPPPKIPRVPSDAYRNKSWQDQQLRSRDIQTNVQAWNMNEEFMPKPWQRDKGHTVPANYNQRFR